MSTRFSRTPQSYLLLLAAMATSSVGGASYEAADFVGQYLGAI